jgi:hypothetical protein
MRCSRDEKRVFYDPTLAWWKRSQTYARGVWIYWRTLVQQVAPPVLRLLVKFSGSPVSSAWRIR